MILARSIDAVAAGTESLPARREKGKEHRESAVTKLVLRGTVFTRTPPSSPVQRMASAEETSSSLLSTHTHLDYGLTPLPQQSLPSALPFPSMHPPDSEAIHASCSTSSVLFTSPLASSAKYQEPPQALAASTLSLHQRSPPPLTQLPSAHLQALVQNRQHLLKHLDDIFATIRQYIEEYPERWADVWNPMKASITDYRYS